MESHGQATVDGRTYKVHRVGCVNDADASVVRVVHISDTHGDAKQLKIPTGDILIHSGDFFNWSSSSDFDDDIRKLKRFFGTQRDHRHKVCCL